MSHLHPTDDDRFAASARVDVALDTHTGRYRPLVSSAPMLAPWSAPPAPTGFTSTPPARHDLPSWWPRAVRGALSATLVIMVAKAALLLGLLRF